MKTKHTSIDLLNSKEEYYQALQLRNEQLASELNFIKNSRGYIFLERTKRTAFAGFITRIIKWIMPGVMTYPVPIQVKIADEQKIEVSESNNLHAQISKQQDHLTRTASDQEWVAKQSKEHRPLSINHPEWRGILSASTELFNNIYLVPDDLNEEKASFYAELFHDAAPPSITIQGFPLTYYHLVKAIKKATPHLPIYVIYHGNFLHAHEDYDWNSFKIIISLYRDGDINKVGFVKKGMAEVINQLGIKSQFIMNLVRRIPIKPSKTYQDKIHVGIWAYPDWSWKKLPYAMIASLGLITDCKGYVHNVSPRAQEFGRLLNIKAEYVFDSLAQEDALKQMSKMHLNMNISLTECAPMVPLESLSVGVPCLFGPTSHYFLDHDYLHSRLVVPYPDNSEIIARYANQALEERTDIINAYREYAPEYNLRALDCLEKFLEYPINKS